MKYTVYEAGINGTRKAIAKGCELPEANAYKESLETDNPSKKYFVLPDNAKFADYAGMRL